MSSFPRKQYGMKNFIFGLPDVGQLKEMITYQTTNPISILCITGSQQFQCTIIIYIIILGSKVDYSLNWLEMSLTMTDSIIKVIMRLMEELNLMKMAFFFTNL